MEITSDTPSWEACKENVLPLKVGRSVRKFGESSLALRSESHSLDKIEAKNDWKSIEKDFDNKIDSLLSHRDKQNVDGLAVTDSSLSLSKQILDEYIKYFKWLRNTYTSNSQKALKVLEKCTYDLKNETEVKNDTRFVKLWIEYADMVRTPGEVFNYMMTNKIGEKVSLFWIAWAFVAEKAENYKLTDQVFQKGIRRMAEPKDLLQKRYQQFQRRLARHYLNQAEEGTSQIAENGDHGAGKSRKALQSLTKSLGSSADRVGNVVDQHSLNGTTGSQTSRAQPAHQRSNKTTVKQKKNAHDGVGFQIFSESDGHGTRADAKSTWNNFGTEEERRKENEGKKNLC